MPKGRADEESKMFIRSERLFLRPGWPEDASDLLAVIGDEAVLRNLDRAPWPYRPDPAFAPSSPVAALRYPHFLVTLPGPDGTRLIGCAGLAACDGETELGVFTAPAHSGQGFATEAARSVLSLARTLGHERIIARPFMDQTACRRVLEKIGFRPTGLVRSRFNPARSEAQPALILALDVAAPGNCDGPQDPEGIMRAA
jgi:RimJ/RimL family protein N-acetyltransferase